jgi:NADH-quinone oxidoreductase subunit E
MRVKRVLLKEENTVPTTLDLGQLDYLIKKYKHKKGNLIPLLQGTQEMFGFIPREAFEKLAAETGIKLSEMYGVATFYAQFRLNPVGKYVIKVCHGTACHVQNANSITDALKESLGVLDGGTTEDNLFTLESVACLGCCSLAPVMMIAGETYGKLSGGSCVKIVKNIRLQENN